MGYPMAINLRKKLPQTSKLVICDVNQEAISRFVEETKDPHGTVAVATTPKEVAASSVSLFFFRFRAGSLVFFPFRD